LLFYTIMVKKWVCKPLPDQEQAEHLSKAINVNPTLASLLIQRGINSFQQAKNFFRPHLNQLHDPFLMKDMDKAIYRINQAISNNENILVYGDYDVDGTTAVALFFGFLSTHYQNLYYYIPDRYAEGYGISSQGIEWAFENNISLVISLDCGIKAINRVSEANEKGIDFIICDHHRPGEELPAAYAILDPKRKDCQYPFKELSGCGVGFKLLQAFCMASNLSQDNLYTYLDLVAVSIASDIVPITGENRVLAYFGLKQLNQAPKPGLKCLIDSCGYKDQIDINEIVFGIGPRINAAGRIAHANTAVALLLAKDYEQARLLAEGIIIHNTERKSHDSHITQEALAMIEASIHLQKAKTTVLFKNDWHKGVIGIVASRCIEKYYRPTIILTQSNNKASGSARSVHGFDVYEAISECADLLDQFGGHMYAAGLTLDIDKVAEFTEKFEQVVAAKITADQLTPVIDVDLVIPFDRITFKFYNIIKQMGPFGPENMHPVFVSENVYALGYPKILKKEHLKMTLMQEGLPYKIEAIGFGLAHFYEQICNNGKFHIAFTIEENNFMGNKSLQLYIKDIKFD
jgi:single-stranded-DNA-specific exonuclease